jgi:GNAT superfamily N-acetyltransferase
LSKTSFVVRPATAAIWKDLVALFGPRGACGGCWCMAWRRSPKAWQAGKGESNRRALRALVASGAPVGVIAYDGVTPIGWCSTSPRSAFDHLARSRVLKPLDEREVWSVSCLFVAKSHRARGVSVALLRGAADFARAQGATILEGYPVVPRAKLPDVFAWTGTLAAFERAGFAIAGRHSPSRPIVRLELAQ